jgi:hypothetical protein
MWAMTVEVARGVVMRGRAVDRVIGFVVGFRTT